MQLSLNSQSPNSSHTPNQSHPLSSHWPVSMQQLKAMSRPSWAAWLLHSSHSCTLFFPDACKAPRKKTTPSSGATRSNFLFSVFYTKMTVREQKCVGYTDRCSPTLHHETNLLPSLLYQIGLLIHHLRLPQRSGCATCRGVDWYHLSTLCCPTKGLLCF
jgi:hypothetical protein